MKERIILTSSDHRNPAETGQPHEFSVSHKFVAPFSGSQIHFAEDSKNNPVVIKFAPSPKSSQREWLALKKVQNISGTQQGILIGESDSGQVGIVTEFVEGKELSQQNTGESRYHFGQLLHTVHESTPIDKEEWHKYGRADRSLVHRSLEYWHREEIHVLFTDSLALPVLKQLFAAVESLPVSLPSFTHQDIHEGQVIIGSNGPTLIDFEVWQEADPLEDLAMYLLHLLREQKDVSSFIPLLEGYFLTKNYTDSTALHLSFYALFDACYAVSYLAKRKPDLLQQAVDNLERVLQFVQTEQFWKLRPSASLPHTKNPRKEGA